MTDAFASLRPLEPLMDACVHCGFCLQTCPSYLLLGKETDSPRGRIYMMRAGAGGHLAMEPPVVEHFDTCLGCMACETACPSGVHYAPLIERTRAAIERHHQRPLAERWFRRLLFAVLPYPFRLRALAAPMRLGRFLLRIPFVGRLLPASIRAGLTLAPDAWPASVWRETAAYTAASGSTRLRVGLLTGCVQRAFFGDINRATARVLSAEGCDVHAPAAQGCCGALALHAGEPGRARAFAQALIQTFEPLDLDIIAVNAAGCGSAMKDYASLFADDPAWSARAARFAAKVRDVSEILAGLEPLRAPRRPVTARVAYHDACHLAHAQGVRQPPRTLLAGIPGVTVVPFAEPDICCGSAGIFNLVQPGMAAALGDRKAGHINDVQPDIVVTSNPGCILQLRAAAARAGHRYRVMHLVELLEAHITF
jgi:glycolate oxidase iron-sulfur subunit